MGETTKLATSSLVRSLLCLLFTKVAAVIVFEVCFGRLYTATALDSVRMGELWRFFT